MVVACERLNKKDTSRAKMLLEAIEKEIFLKKDKGYNPTAVLVSVEYYSLLMSAYGNQPISPVRSDIYYSSIYGLRLILLPGIVHNTFMQVLCSDERKVGEERNKSPYIGPGGRSDLNG